MNKKVKGLTATVIFESSAVNRDDKLAGNITSVKKLSRGDGTYTFMSRAFIRHHMFATLNQLFGWDPAPITVDKVLQFKYPQANVVEYKEMDIFGYMNTSEGVIRKAPLGITKAISLEPWQADMAFYANHDLVHRAVASGLEADPNPFQKEEHHSLYKVTFTLDLIRLGYQEIFSKAIPTNIEEWMRDLPDADSGTVLRTGNRQEDDTADSQWKSILDRDENVLGFVGILKTKEVTILKWVISKAEYRKRVSELLTVIKNGLMIHSSTEDYGMVPSFIILGALKVPVPIFHSAVGLNNGAVNADLLNKALKNDYIENCWYDSILPIKGKLTTDTGTAELSEWTSIDDIVKNIL